MKASQAIKTAYTMASGNQDYLSQPALDDILLESVEFFGDGDAVTTSPDAVLDKLSRLINRFDRDGLTGPADALYDLIVAVRIASGMED